VWGLVGTDSAVFLREWVREVEVVNDDGDNNGKEMILITFIEPLKEAVKIHVSLNYHRCVTFYWRFRDRSICFETALEVFFILFY